MLCDCGTFNGSIVFVEALDQCISISMLEADGRQICPADPVAPRGTLTAPNECGRNSPDRQRDRPHVTVARIGGSPGRRVEGCETESLPEAAVVREGSSTIEVVEREHKYALEPSQQLPAIRVRARARGSTQARGAGRA